MVKEVFKHTGCESCSQDNQVEKIIGNGMQECGKKVASAIYRFNSSFTHDIFHRIRQNNLKIYMEPQKTQNCKGNSEGKQQS